MFQITLFFHSHYYHLVPMIKRVVKGLALYLLYSVSVKNISKGQLQLISMILIVHKYFVQKSTSNEVWSTLFRKFETYKPKN